MTKDTKRPTITLKTGHVVDAREAAALWRQMGALLEVDSDKFHTLLALAQDRPSDANPAHFESLWAGTFLEMDRRTISLVAKAVLLNSYEAGREGEMIVPLRLQDEADRPIAEEALAQCDQWLRNFVSRKKGKGRSPD